MPKNDTQSIFEMVRTGGSRGTRDDGATSSMGGLTRPNPATTVSHGHNEIAARTEGIAGRAASERFAAGPDGNFKFSAPMPANELGRDIDPVRNGGTVAQTEGGRK